MKRITLGLEYIPNYIGQYERAERVYYQLDSPKAPPLEIADIHRSYELANLDPPSKKAPLQVPFLHAVLLAQVVPGNQLPEAAINKLIEGGIVSKALEETFTEVQQAGRVMFLDGFMRIEDALIQNQRIYFADPEIMEIFSFPVEHGYDSDALSEPFAVLITRHAASQYFGTDEPVGKTLSFANRLDFRVRAF